MLRLYRDSLLKLSFIQIKNFFSASLINFKFSNLSCQQMDLYTDLIQTNLKTIETAEKKGKFNEAISYCLNVYRLKQKLYGVNYGSQFEEFMKISNLYVAMKDNQNALDYLEKALLFSIKDETFREIYYRKANIFQNMSKFEETIEHYERTYYYSKKLYKEKSKTSEELNELLKLLEISSKLLENLQHEKNERKIKILALDNMNNLENFKKTYQMSLFAKETQDLLQKYEEIFNKI